MPALVDPNDGLRSRGLRLERLKSPNLHAGIGKLLCVLGADAEPLRCREMDVSAVNDAVVCLNATPANCRVTIWRGLAFAINPLDLAGVHCHLYKKNGALAMSARRFKSGMQGNSGSPAAIEEQRCRLA
jgi:hypothetical protein